MNKRGVVIALAAVVIAVAAVYLFLPINRPATRTTEAPETTAAPGTQLGSAAAAAKTAAAHASFASEGTSVSYVREHLGHVILCLEGPQGNHVNAAWENPCQGQGNGVLNDLGSARPSWILVVQAADDLAVRALRSDDLAEARISARGVAALMKLVADAP